MSELKLKKGTRALFKFDIVYLFFKKAICLYRQYPRMYVVYSYKKTSQLLPKSCAKSVCTFQDIAASMIPF